MEKEAVSHAAKNLEVEETFLANALNVDIIDSKTTLEDKMNNSFDVSQNVENEPLIQMDQPIKLTGKLSEVWNIW